LPPRRKRAPSPLRTYPISVIGTPAALAARRNAASFLGATVKRDLIVVATGQHRFHQFGFGGERCARSLRERHLRHVDVNRHF
jgi:hypothetical protein